MVEEALPELFKCHCHPRDQCCHHCLCLTKKFRKTMIFHPRALEQIHPHHIAGFLQTCTCSATHVDCDNKEVQADGLSVNNFETGKQGHFVLRESALHGLERHCQQGHQGGSEAGSSRRRWATAHSITTACVAVLQFQLVAHWQGHLSLEDGSAGATQDRAVSWPSVLLAVMWPKNAMDAPACSPQILLGYSDPVLCILPHLALQPC